MKKSDRFVIVLPLVQGGMVERYYQRATRDGRPVGTMNLRLARKWDSVSEANRWCQAVSKNPRWRAAYVGTA